MLATGCQNLGRLNRKLSEVLCTWNLRWRCLKLLKLTEKAHSCTYNFLWCWKTYSLGYSLCNIVHWCWWHLVFRTFYPLSPFYRFIRVVRQINGRTLRNKEKMAIQEMLIGYRSTPHPATGITPYEGMMNRTVRTKLDYENRISNTSNKERLINERDRQ